MSDVPRQQRQSDPRATEMFVPVEVSPERRLWIAVLECALQDINAAQSYGERFQARRAAIDWIGSRRFREVCLLAGFEPDYIEKGIRARLEAGERFDLNNRRIAPDLAA